MTKIFTTTRVFLLAIAALMFSTNVSAQTTITSADGLAAIANDLAGNYVLGSDITLTGEWTPIGTEDDPFTGTLDGANYSIYGLVINHPDEEDEDSNMGLFSFTDGATIKNLRLPNVSVVGYKQVGAIAGQAIGTTIDACYVSGCIKGYDHVGAIVGDVRGDISTNVYSTVSNCLAVALVYSEPYQAGVVAGWTNAGILTHNIAYGTARSRAYAAGIISFVDNEGYGELIENVMASGAVYAGYAPYGILGGINTDCSTSMADNYYGLDDVSFYQSYSPYDPFETENEQWMGDPLSTSQLTTASTYTGAYLTLDANLWDIADGRLPVLKGISLPIDADFIYFEEDLPTICAVNANYELSLMSAMGRDVTITSSDDNIVSVAGTTLYFNNLGTATITFTTVGDNYVSGASTSIELTVETQNYNLSTPQDLLNMQYDLTGDYTLEADIDMSGVDFTPFNTFTGTFDGQGHTIKNLKYDENTGVSNVGLFASATGATIKNLGIEGASFNGDSNVAALVGVASGCTVDQCWVLNSYIEGRDHVGSFFGNLNYATITDEDGVSTQVGTYISNCLSTATIYSRAYQGGGITGVSNGGTIDKCLFAGTVDVESSNVAGLVGLLDGSDYLTTLCNNFSAPAHLFGLLTDTSWGGTAEVDIDARLIHVYSRWDGIDYYNNYAAATTSITSGGAKISGTGGKNELGGLTVESSTAKSKSFYTDDLGWDMDNVWTFIDGGEGRMYPVLKQMKTPITVEVFDLPSYMSLIYTDGSDKIDLSTIMGSLAQPLTWEITEGADLVDYDASEDCIWAGDANGYYVGAGFVTAKASSALSGLTTVGDTSFQFYVCKQGDEMEISTPHEFVEYMKYSMPAYRLTADLDMSDTWFHGIAVDGIPFSGTLNGDGHKVSNLGVDYTEGGSNKGIFGETNGATFRNIAFENFCVTSNYGDGSHIGFVGSATNTTFENCAFTGYVYGNDHVAILAGDSDGARVNNCYVWGYAEAYSQIGGFFGCTIDGGATVTNSYYNGELYGTTRGWTGGIIGLIDVLDSEVTVTGCASMGLCSNTGGGSPHVSAPIIAGNGADIGTPRATITAYDNIYLNGAEMIGSDNADYAWPSINSTIEGGYVEYPVAKNSGDLSTQSTYEAIGWDFNDTWAFATNGYPYPILKSLGYIDFDLDNIMEGIDTPAAAEKSHYVVDVYGGKVIVSGLDGTAKVALVNIAGQTVATTVATGSVELSMPAAGIYIVSVECNGTRQAVKVVNK